MTATDIDTPPEAPPGLTIDTVLPYLLDKHLLSRAVVVDDWAIEIQDRTRRNRNFLVSWSAPTGLLLKQAGNAFDEESAATLKVEADLLRAVARDDLLKAVRWFSPRFVYSDPADHVVVLELLRPATSLTKFHLNAGDIDFAPQAALTAGRVLARFHRTLTRGRELDALPELPAKEPFAFEVPMFARVLAESGDVVAAEFVQRLAATRVFDDLDAAREAWATGSSVVHGDVRWDNFIVTSGAAPADNLNVRLIDWELARIGDEVWDVVAYLGEYLRFWSLSAAMLSDDPDAEPAAAFTFAEYHESVRVFLDAYIKTARLGARGRARLMRHIATYLPIHLALVAFEGIQRQTEMPLGTRLLLEFAARALTDPDAAITEWFGVSTKETTDVR